MRYFFDTEFIEGFHKPLFSKRRHFIDLISIGIAAEDGSELYLISNEYNYNDADEWVKENVILPLYIQTVSGDARNWLDVTNFHKFYGVSNKDISFEVMKFVWKDAWRKWDGLLDEFLQRGIEYGWNTGTSIEFYAYYADYDWVVFCSLFGRMIDLPKGFPMYCIDLKQMLDEKIDRCSFYDYGEPLKGCSAYENFEGKLELTKLRIDYPKQKNEHSALDDAKWNKQLYDLIKII